MFEFTVFGLGYKGINKKRMVAFHLAIEYGEEGFSNIGVAIRRDCVYGGWRCWEVIPWCIVMLQHCDDQGCYACNPFGFWLYI